MLKSKIAMALAVAMVLATLYGCSSGVSDSEHNQVKDQVTDLTGTIDAVAAALGLAAGSSEAAILAAIGTATADELAAIRTQLELTADADSAAIVAAIVALQAAPEPTPPVFVDQSGLPDDVMYMDGSQDIPAGGSVTIGEVTYSCAAGDEDCTVTVNNGAAVSTGGAVTAAVSSGYTTRIVNETRIAAATKSAGTKRTAISAEGMQGPGQTPANPDAGIGGSVADGDTTTYSYTISRDRDGTEIKITDSAMAGDDDPKFMQMMDPGDGITRHVRDNGEGVEEVVMVRTDIEAPKGVAFAEWEAMDGTTPQQLDVMSDDGAAPDADETADALDIPEDTTLTGDANANLMFARSTMDGSLNYTQDNPVPDETTATVDEGLHDGTYNGAEGTYRCTGTAPCTVTFNAKREVTGNSDNWVFVPDKGATSDQPDYDYLDYGFWLKRTTKDGALTYNEVETFTRSSVDAVTDISAVVETATYDGDALGVYVHSVIDSDGSETSATSGHFTADASLTAYFGGGDVAANKQNTITGTINNFELSGGEANSWSVTLESSAASTDGTHSGTAKGGGTSDGSFSTIFYGTADADNKPHSVLGEFNSNFTNGSAAGAFGARIKEE